MTRLRLLTIGFHYAILSLDEHGFHCMKRAGAGSILLSHVNRRRISASPYLHHPVWPIELHVDRPFLFDELNLAESSHVGACSREDSPGRFAGYPWIQSVMSEG